MTPRQLFHWKTLFYDAILPLLRLLGPPRRFGVARARAAHIKVARSRERHACDAHTSAKRLGADWDLAALGRDLTTNRARFAARDYLLDRISDADVLSRFEVRGFEYLQRRCPRGAVSSYWDAIWELILRACTGYFESAYPHDCLFSGPGTCRDS